MPTSDESRTSPSGRASNSFPIPSSVGLAQNTTAGMNQELGDDREFFVTELPFTQEGDSITFLSERMRVNEPCLFRLLEWWFVAIKRVDGQIDFQYVQ